MKPFKSCCRGCLDEDKQAPLLPALALEVVKLLVDVAGIVCFASTSSQPYPKVICEFQHLRTLLVLVFPVCLRT